VASITSARTDAYKGKNTKSDYNISDKVGKAIDARAQKRKLCLRKQRLIKVPIPVYFTTSIQCELDKFYEEVNAMQHQEDDEQNNDMDIDDGRSGGRRKRRSSKLKRRNN